MHLSLIRFQATLIMIKNNCHQMAKKVFQPSSKCMPVNFTGYAAPSTVFQIKDYMTMLSLYSTLTLKTKGNFIFFLEEIHHKKLHS